MARSTSPPAKGELEGVENFTTSRVSIRIIFGDRPTLRLVL